MNILNSSASTDSPTRDETYYFEDGNCVLRAGDRLFKLHRSLLQLRSTFFRKMFSLPQDSSQAPHSPSAINGETDDRPITCDDPAEAFRALCWAIYADPLEISQITKLDEDTLAYIGLLAHKYEFSAIEQWTINICHEIPKSETLMSSPTESLKLLWHTITICGWQEIKTQLITNIANDVSNEKDPSAITTASTLSRALRIADDINDDTLRAAAYSAYLDSVQWNLNPARRVDDLGLGILKLTDIKDFSLTGTLSSLSEGEKLCLYRGYSSLLALRSQLRNMPIFMGPFPADCLACDSSCPDWRSWWSEQVIVLDGRPMYDGPVPLLREMLRQVEKSPPGKWHGRYDSKCSMHVKAKIAKVIKTIEDDLHMYFAVVI